MTSRLRALGLRAAPLCALVVTLLTGHAAVGKPDLPLVLLDSFDQAFAVVYDAAERKVAALEAAASPAPPRRDVCTLLHELERNVTLACEAASTALDVELALAGSLSPERRNAVLGCIERHLGEARHALSRATDLAERAEYTTSCERLREVRRMI
jgi:hypothetical protein